MNSEPAAHHILMVGCDELLLHTRRAILSKRWSVETASMAETQKILTQRTFQLLVLCTSLSNDECERLLFLARQQSPSTLVMVLEANMSRPDGADAYTSTLTPTAWLGTIEKLLEQDTAI